MQRPDVFQPKRTWETFGDEPTVPIRGCRERPIHVSDDELFESPTPKRPRLSCVSPYTRNPLLRKALARRSRTGIFEHAIWFKILSYSFPADILNWRRISDYFEYLASSEELWKHVLFLQYPDAPICSTCSAERYVQLLAFKGCDSCSSRKTWRPQWAFGHRWCEKHFKERVVKSYEAQRLICSNPVAAVHREELMQCLKGVIIDSWGGFQCVYVPGTQEPVTNSGGADVQAAGHQEVASRSRRIEDDRFNHRQRAAYNWKLARVLRKDVAYLKEDVSNLITEYTTAVDRITTTSSWSGEANQLILRWKQDRVSQTQERLREAYAIEQYALKLRSKEQVEGPENFENERQNFLIRQARRLRPPLTREALLLIPEVQKAIRGKGQATMKIWDAILPKVLDKRASVEDQLARLEEPCLKPISALDRLRFERQNNFADDAQSLMQLVDRTLDDMSDRLLNVTFYTAQALHRIWRGYQLLGDERPAELSYDLISRADDLYLNEEGTAQGERKHILTLFDARWIYRCKILHRIRSHLEEERARLDADAGELQASEVDRMILFPCSECCDSRTRSAQQRQEKLWSFDRLFEHIRASHGMGVGGRFVDYDIASRRYGAPEGKIGWAACEWTEDLPTDIALSGTRTVS